MVPSLHLQLLKLLPQSRPPLAPWGLTQQQEVLALSSLSPLEALPAAQGLALWPVPSSGAFE